MTYDDWADSLDTRQPCTSCSQPSDTDVCGECVGDIEQTEDAVMRQVTIILGEQEVASLEVARDELRELRDQAVTTDYRNNLDEAIAVINVILRRAMEQR